MIRGFLAALLLWGFQDPPSPLTAQDQLKTFTLPEGFSVELAAGDPDIAKVVDIAWDGSGRMWAVTATEYPVDGNETPGAIELYRKGGKDRVLVFDAEGKPRPFATELAMPMAVMPYRDGALVGHGPDILFLRDIDGDGVADKREVVLTGFGIQDSHLMPHRFVRGPGDWIYVAQGAFNASQVKTKDGATVRFDQCKVGRFKADGSRFEVVGTGLNNIWGFVIDPRGEMYLQEANDLGYPVVPFFIGASYPGIGNHRAKPYSPFQPPLAKFQMGGTGLSGLALSEDPQGYPEPWKGVFFVANPITRKVQAIRVHREGGGHRLEKLPDFLSSTDPWFRPIAIHFGPDGCLYIVDWYNKIISHNEVPRNHPERDKTRSRIWRVRHASMPARRIPDVARASDEELFQHLTSDSTWAARAAWHQIVDGKRVSMQPALRRIAETVEQPVHKRLLALWSLEGLGKADRETFRKLAGEPDRALRREAIRVSQSEELALMLLQDPDPQVREEVIRALDAQAFLSSKAIAALLQLGVAPFERSLARAALEKHPKAVAEFLDGAKELSAGQRALALLTLEPSEGARRLAATADASLSEEELLLLANHADDPAVAGPLGKLLKEEKALEVLLKVRTRVDSRKVAGLVVAAVREKPASLLFRVAAAFRLLELESEIAAALSKKDLSKGDRLAGLRALVEMGAQQSELFRPFAVSGDAELQREGVAGLSACRDEKSLAAMIQLWPSLPVPLRKPALDRMAGTKPGAAALLEAVRAGQIPREALDAGLLDKLKAALGDHAYLKELSGRMTTVLRLGGQAADYVDSNLSLDGAFTVETWIKLDPGISNRDGILGAPGVADFNFHDGKFRVWLGPEADVIVANKSIEPEVWTHVAVTRSAGGAFKIYLNGQLDGAQGKESTRALKGLDIGRTAPGGTAGQLAECRVWTVERTAEQIGEFFNLTAGAQAGLVFPGSGTWGRLSGKARIEGTLDGPPMITEAEARVLREKFEKFRALAAREGNDDAGRELFIVACMTCHKAGGRGGEIGPNLDGAGHLGNEGLLRAILTPSAAVESGYRVFRLETRDGEIVDGLLVSQDDGGFLLRQVNREDFKVPRASVRRSGYSKLSVMPEGILEGLKPEQVSDLFSFLRLFK